MPGLSKTSYAVAIPADPMEKKQTLLFILISASSIILLIVLFVTVLILRSSGTNTSEQVVSLPADRVTPTLTILTPDGPASSESRLETTYPFSLEGAIPEELWMEVTDNSVDGYQSFDTTLQGDDSFSIVITSLSADAEATPAERVKYNPPQYAYDPADFVRIATVNGQELYVSRTGGAQLVESSDEGQLVSVPQMEAAADLGSPYYVYQKYQYGLSEYISAFGATTRTTPSYDNHTIIRYGISDEGDATKWNTYQRLLQKTVTGISQ